MIRPITRGDLPAMKAVIDAVELFPSEMLDDMTASYFTSVESDEFWLTCDEGNGPIAVAYCAPEPMTDGTWNLHLIAVRAENQGNGRGASMMHYVEVKLAERGARVLLVETSGTTEFERTRAFYRKIGYDEEARIREFYSAGDDMIVFWKSLTEAV